MAKERERERERKRERELYNVDISTPGLSNVSFSTFPLFKFMLTLIFAKNIIVYLETLVSSFIPLNECDELFQCLLLGMLGRTASKAEALV